VTLDRLTVRAPVAGRILKVAVRPGQFVVAGETAEPPVLLGNDRPLFVRVQVDENDVWRLRPAAAAEAVVRGNRDLRFPLSFVRIEPYVLPKRSLTGDRTERIDTRVLEVLYSFDPGDRPIFIGQQVDVFIDAVDARSSAAAP
jgi:multidrug efflux pump subunit AcrA (membrane-fusion protein)